MFCTYSAHHELESDLRWSILIIIIIIITITITVTVTIIIVIVVIVIVIVDITILLIIDDMLFEGRAVMQEARAESHETWLFHGAHTSCIELIAAKGFDIRVSRHGMLGQGTYFANCSAYSDKYVDALPALICP